MTDPFNINLQTLNSAVMPKITELTITYINEYQIKLLWNEYNAKCIKSTIENETNYDVEYDLNVGFVKYNIYYSNSYDGSNNFIYLTTIDSNEYNFSSTVSSVFYFKIVGIIKNDYEDTFEQTKPSNTVSATILYPIKYIHLINDDILTWENQIKLSDETYEVFYKKTTDSAYTLLTSVTANKIKLSNYSNLTTHGTYQLKVRITSGIYHSVFSNVKKYIKK